ncbi:MAG: carboxypeptidase-like regulatory domain-containing protein [Muribaculaceae bacterium]|nr:carboxypeptidase-like regulatory domain-containing protein [Muribaculaceae bacterium]MDE6702486.1 carboxypeptidase-like regulatory domain-containing protein [Muribaculaceae bacterium]
MNCYSILRNRSNLFVKTLKCAFVAAALIFISGCSGSDDYEIFATIQGTVTDYETGAVLDNATVTLTPSGLSRQTDASGFYRFNELDAKQYTLTVQKAGYQPNRRTVTTNSGQTHQVDVQLKVIPQ